MRKITSWPGSTPRHREVAAALLDEIECHIETSGAVEPQRAIQIQLTVEQAESLLARLRSEQA